MPKSNVKRTRIPRREWTRRRLQKEVGCKCPFCDRTDVEDFEIHHINGDCCNHDECNLMLVCGACHNAFSKVLQLEKVQAAKLDFMREFQFLPMNSTNFDYVAYNMKSENGRIPQDDPNGSKARLTVIDRSTLILQVIEANDATWTGYMAIKHRSFGEMSWRYRTCYEFGQKVFELETRNEGSQIIDTVFVQSAHYSTDHGRELFIRTSSAAETPSA